MEVHQLRYAVAVADAGSFTAAAQSLHVSQSGVSAQVARLERELGLTLFDRSARTVTTTPAGDQLLARIRGVLAALDDVRSTADHHLGLLRGRARIGAVAGLTWPAFLDALVAIRTEHPGLEISLTEGLSLQLQDQVADGRLDIAVVSWARSTRPGLNCWVALQEHVTAVVSPTHPWATRTVLSPADLLDAEIICMAHGTGMRAAYEAMMHAEAHPAPVAWEVTLPSTVRTLAERGLGVGIVTSSRADPVDKLVHLPIRSQHAISQLGVVWRGRPSPGPPTEAVLEALRSQLGRP
ncbi:MAG: LysR family transcriptional regulator [Actinobacteria bacterium]|nr:LysR family transcriptional regulator [Actinomycetota bacterium]